MGAGLDNAAWRALHVYNAAMIRIFLQPVDPCDALRYEILELVKNFTSTNDLDGLQPLRSRT
jgi:hypothetical protein